MYFPVQLQGFLLPQLIKHYTDFHIMRITVDLNSFVA